MRDSTLLTKGVKDMWIQWAGIPKQITHDQGGEFIAEAVETFPARKCTPAYTLLSTIMAKR